MIWFSSKHKVQRCVVKLNGFICRFSLLFILVSLGEEEKNYYSFTFSLRLVGRGKNTTCFHSVTGIRRFHHCALTMLMIVSFCLTRWIGNDPLKNNSLSNNVLGKMTGNDNNEDGYSYCHSHSWNDVTEKEIDLYTQRLAAYVHVVEG